jgi:CheY-specific phosphatase CheX
MTTALNSILQQITEETLENLAFVFSFSGDEDDDMENHAEATVVSVSFSGPFSGCIEMHLPSEALPEIAANMLGLEEEETTKDDQHGAVCEALNVICGNLLPVIAGKEVVFDIDSPGILSMENKKDPERADAQTLLILDNGPCLLLLWLSDDAHGQLIDATLET